MSGRFPVSESAYDAHGELIVSSVFTNGTDVVTETYGYDSFGRKVLSVNALGVVTTTGYDANGNVVSEQGASYPVRFAYDSQGRRVSMQTNRSGDTWDETRWKYDPSTGLCTSKTYEDGSVVRYEYTPDGLLETTRTADGHWTRNVYDAKRQVVGVCYAGGNDVAYVRDVYGRETTASNAAAAYVLEPESGGIATSEVVTIAGASQTYARSVDDAGRLASFDVDDAYAGQFFGYRADGAIGTVSNADALVAYSYSADGYETGYSLSLAGGPSFVRTVSRDPYRRDLVLNVANAIGEDYGYSYDALSRPVTRNADAFQYNDRSEVTGATAGGASEEYAYDNIGNATFAFAYAVTNTYAANGLNQYVAVTTDGMTVQPAYDGDGNLVSFGDWSYAYDSAARLTEVRSNGVLVASNDYDHKGRRVRKVTPEASYTFFYDGWNVVLELVEKGGATDRIEYYWGTDISGTFQGAGGVGGLLYLKRNGSIFVPIYDAYGNVMEYRAADGSLAASYVYDAFGRTVSQTGALADVFRFRHATKSCEVESGLYYYGKRFCLPELRRWLNRDPAEERGGLNIYAFCVNDPVSCFDRNGLAYFAVRRLHGGGLQNAMAKLFRCPFLSNWADKGNFEIAHEQLFYEDGSGNIGWGNDVNATGKGDFMRNERASEYVQRDGGYNDCVMHIAEAEVGRPSHYQAWVGESVKCNCQDYADKLRNKYREIFDREDVRCKCKLPFIVR